MLGAVERQQGARTDINLSQAATMSVGLYATINNLKKDTAYRWITMSFAPRSSLLVPARSDSKVALPLSPTAR